MDETAVTGLLAAATGGAAPELARQLMRQVTDTLGLSFDPADEEDDSAKARAALQTLQAAAPRDPLEAMLAVQMAGCHEAAMRALKRAAECSDYPKIEALYARQAARLMQLFTRQMEALERRRAQQPAAEARDAERQAQPIAVSEKRRANGPKPPPRRTTRKSARHNGTAATPAALRNSRQHRINGAGAPP